MFKDILNIPAKNINYDILKYIKLLLEVIN